MHFNNLDEFLALEEIKRLRVLYGHYLDGHNLDGLAGLFTPDAVCELDFGTLRGREAIRAGLASVFAEYDKNQHGSYPFLHAVTNQWVERTGPETAQGRCYLLDFTTARHPTENPLLLLGIYADEYQLLDGQWLISRTRLDLIWPQRNGGGGEPGKNMVLPE